MKSAILVICLKILPQSFYCCRFRKQHEQLRAVILRVLRPTEKPAITDGASGSSETQMMDMADANAINEVDMAYENFKEIDPLDISKEGIEAWEVALKR